MQRQVSLAGPSIVGCSDALRRAVALVERYAPITDPILLVGPTGVGKGLLARELHRRAARDAFVQLSGGHLVDTLYHAQLFGHTRGAYTGATRDAPGAFEQARGGTLFLDELPLWSRAAQAAVLQAVEEGWVQPVGAERRIPVACRMLFGSNRRPEQLVAEGRLMEDLQYRIGEFVIEIPPLAERRVDIAVLAFHFLDGAPRLAGANGPVGFSWSALELLLSYDWPGNARQLKSAIRFACINATGRERIVVEHLPACVRNHRGHLDATTQRDVTAWVFERCGRNRCEAARRLDIHRNTVAKRLRQARA